MMQTKSNVRARYLWFREQRNDPWRIIAVYRNVNVWEFGDEFPRPLSSYKGYFWSVKAPELGGVKTELSAYLEKFHS